MQEVFKEFFRGALESGGTLVVIDSKAGQIIGSSLARVWMRRAAKVSSTKSPLRHSPQARS